MSAPQQPGSACALQVIRDLVGWFVEHADEVPDAHRLEGSSDLQAAVDDVAGMSGRYAIRVHGARSRPAAVY